MKRNALKWGLGLLGLVGVGVLVSRLLRSRSSVRLPDEPDIAGQDA